MANYFSDVVLLFGMTIGASLISFFAFAISINHSRSKNSHSYQSILVRASTNIKKLYNDWHENKILTALRALLAFMVCYFELKQKNAIGRMDMWVVRILIFFLVTYSTVGFMDVAYEIMKWLNS